MSEISLLSGIPGLLFDSPFLSPLFLSFFLSFFFFFFSFFFSFLFFSAYSPLVIFLLMVHSPDFFPENSQIFFVKGQAFLYGSC